MQANDMKRVIYRSRATQSFDLEALLAMLVRARMTNADRRITGVLIHENGLFLQMLEGPANEIDDLVQRILRDPRHDQMELFAEEACQTRWCGDWSMDIADYAGLPARFAGLWTPTLPRHLEDVSDREAAETVLRVFHDAIA